MLIYFYAHIIKMGIITGQLKALLIHLPIRIMHGVHLGMIVKTK